jgi:hypothetical protein
MAAAISLPQSSDTRALRIPSPSRRSRGTSELRYRKSTPDAESRIHPYPCTPGTIQQPSQAPQQNHEQHEHRHTYRAKPIILITG